LEKVSGVIPGRADGANPESRSRIAVECRADVQLHICDRRWRSVRNDWKGFSTIC
jgi:hypothetical protein